MTEARPFDPVAFKEKTRREWNDAAAGWRKWYHVVEGRNGGQRHSATLVSLARIGPGASVLDVGSGYGEPGLTAARAAGPGGRVVCTDISASLLDFARERARDAGLENVEFVEPMRSSSTSKRRASTRSSAGRRSCSCRTSQGRSRGCMHS